MLALGLPLGEGGLAATRLTERGDRRFVTTCICREQRVLMPVSDDVVCAIRCMSAGVGRGAWGF